METTVGYQRFVANGTVSPFRTTRVYSIDYYCSASTTSITLWDGLTSSTAYNKMLHCPSDSQGTFHEEWTEGMLFEKGVYLNTAVSSVVVLIGYGGVKA